MKRQFIIEYYLKSIVTYVQEMSYNRVNSVFVLTRHKEKAKVWTYKKSCENAIEKSIESNLYKKYNTGEFKILEITDIKTMRKIKLNKLNKLFE